MTVTTQERPTLKVRRMHDGRYRVTTKDGTRHMTDADLTLYLECEHPASLDPGDVMEWADHLYEEGVR